MLPATAERTSLVVEAHSDDMVWAAVLHGDADQLGVIWDRHRDRVFRHLLGRGATAGEAEDLTAMTFLELWRRRTSVRAVDGSLLPWLLATATNVGRNAARSRRRYQAFLARLPKPADEPDVAQVLLPPERVGERTLTRRWRELRLVDQQLLVLTAVEDFSVAEAAAALGLTESAAKMRLSRLRRRLRAAAAASETIEGESA